MPPTRTTLHHALSIEYCWAQVYLEEYRFVVLANKPEEGERKMEDLCEVISTSTREASKSSPSLVNL